MALSHTVRRRTVTYVDEPVAYRLVVIIYDIIIQTVFFLAANSGLLLYFCFLIYCTSSSWQGIMELNVC